MDNQNQQDIKKKKIWIIPVIIVSVSAILIALLAIIIVIGAVALPRTSVKKNINLGEKYLSEMDYENAILAYRDAIRIDPKNEEAYIGLANAYEEWADYCMEEGEQDKAVKIIERAIKELETARDNKGIDKVIDKIDDMEKKKKKIAEEPTSEKGSEPAGVVTSEKTSEVTSEIIEEPEAFHAVDAASLPEGLQAFLDGLNWAGRYDNESEEIIKGVVENMLRQPDIVCNYSLYTAYCQEPVDYSAQDAKQYVPASNKNGLHYHCYNADGVDWILKNIYNIDDSIIAKMKTPGYFEPSVYYDKETGGIYYSDGRY